MWGRPAPLLICGPRLLLLDAGPPGAACSRGPTVPCSRRAPVLARRSLPDGGPQSWPVPPGVGASARRSSPAVGGRLPAPAECRAAPASPAGAGRPIGPCSRGAPHAYWPRSPPTPAGQRLRSGTGPGPSRAPVLLAPASAGHRTGTGPGHRPRRARSRWAVAPAGHCHRRATAPARAGHGPAWQRPPPRTGPPRTGPPRTARRAQSRWEAAPAGHRLRRAPRWALVPPGGGAARGWG